MIQALNGPAIHSTNNMNALKDKDEESQSLVDAFAQFVFNLQNEIKTLQNISTLKQLISQPGYSISKSSIVEQLTGLESTMKQVEENISYFEEQVDQELNNLNMTKQLLDQAMRQQEELHYLQSLMPKKVPDAAPLTEDLTKTKSYLISEEDFQSVSKTTRGRLSIEKVLESLVALNEYLEAKRKVRVDTVFINIDIV